ncbi:Hsp20/alpha crystallin family protein [Streptomyces mayteni]
MTLPMRRQRPVIDGRRSWGRDTMSEFDDLFNRMGTLLESTVGGGLARPTAWAPLADLTELDDAYLIECELPGIRREDVDIELDERQLVISGEFAEQERKGTLHRGTRRTGRFEYRTMLPGQVDAEGVTATLSDGLLTVRIPKAAGTGKRHIEVGDGS